MFKRSIIKRYYNDNLFEATDFTGYSQIWCCTLEFVAGSLYIFRAKLQPKNMRNSTVFITSNFQDNLSYIFENFQQKVQSQMCPVIFWQIAYYVTLCQSKIVKKLQKSYFLQKLCFGIVDTFNPITITQTAYRHISKTCKNM